MINRDGGFALLIVLWTVALLALLGSVITASGRAETRIAANLSAAAEVQAAADGAIAAAGFHLLDPSSARWQADGAAHRLGLGASTISVTVRDQAGKIDPNETPPALMASLLRQQGIDSGTAAQVAAAVADWRSVSADDLTPIYHAQNRVYLPTHEAFQSLDELSLVAYVTPRLLELLRPHLSLFIEQTPAPAQADALVSAAMQDAIKRDHVAMNEADPQATPSIVLIVASARTAHARFTRRALVRLATDAASDRLYDVLEWDGG